MSKMARRLSFKRRTMVLDSLNRYFFMWYKKSHKNIGIKFVFSRRSIVGPIVFSFKGFNRGLSCYVHENTLSVYFYYQYTFIDIIFDVSAFPEKSKGGLVCGCCDQDKRALYKSLYEFWLGEVFHPFERWITVGLIPAKKVHCQFTDSGSSSATLIHGDDEVVRHKCSFINLISSIRPISIDDGSKHELKEVFFDDYCLPLRID